MPRRRGRPPMEIEHDRGGRGRVVTTLAAARRPAARTRAAPIRAWSASAPRGRAPRARPSGRDARARNGLARTVRSRASPVVRAVAARDRRARVDGVAREREQARGLEVALGERRGGRRAAAAARAARRRRARRRRRAGERRAAARPGRASRARRAAAHARARAAAVEDEVEQLAEEHVVLALVPRVVVGRVRRVGREVAQVERDAQSHGGAVLRDGRRRPRDFCARARSARSLDWHLADPRAPRARGGRRRWPRRPPRRHVRRRARAARARGEHAPCLAVPACGFALGTHGSLGISRARSPPWHLTTRDLVALEPVLRARARAREVDRREAKRSRGATPDAAARHAVEVVVSEARRVQAIVLVSGARDRAGIAPFFRGADSPISSSARDLPA